MNLNLVRAIVESLVFLETSEDDDVNPDAAVKVMEGIAYHLQQLSSEDRPILIAAILKIATEHTDQKQREFIESIPEHFGLE